MEELNLLVFTLVFKGSPQENQRYCFSEWPCFALTCRWSKALLTLENLRPTIISKETAFFIYIKTEYCNIGWKVFQDTAKFLQAITAQFTLSIFESVTQTAWCTCLSLCSSQYWEENTGIHWNNGLKISKCITAQFKIFQQVPFISSTLFFRIVNNSTDQV